MEKVQSGSRTLKISDEVLCKVAALAAQDVEGVAELSGRKLCTLFSAPVEIENLDGAIAVRVRVILKSGYRAVSVAKQVQQAVKQGVQDMTGVTAVHVDVEISGVEAEN
jgi:uncharacterized alkaline shock family protein YloU